MKIFNIIAAFTLTVSTAIAGTGEELQKKLNSAIERGKSEEAQQWAAALNSWEMSQLAASKARISVKGEAVIKGYENILKTAPAAVTAGKLFLNVNNRKGENEWKSLRVAETFIKIINNGPASSGELAELFYELKQPTPSELRWKADRERREAEFRKAPNKR